MKRRWLSWCSALVLSIGCGHSKVDDDSSREVRGAAGLGQGAAGAFGGHAGDAAAGGTASESGGASAGTGAGEGTGASAATGGSSGDGGSSGSGASSQAGGAPPATGGASGHGGMAANAGRSSGGGSPAGGSGTGGNAGSGADGSNDSLPAGQVTVLSLPNYAGLTGVQASATYFAQDYSSGCNEQQVGPCRVYDCFAGPNGGRLDAGDISLASPEVSYEVTLSPSAGLYTSETQSGVFFKGEEMVSATALGHTAPAFQMTVQMPLVLLASSPALDASATSGVIQVPRSDDLVIVWSRGAPGVSLQIQGNSGNASVSCTVDSTLGQVTIPAAVLGLLDAGTMLLPMSVGRTSAVSDAFQTQLFAVMGVYTPDRARRIDFELE